MVLWLMIYIYEGEMISFWFVCLQSIRMDEKQRYAQLIQQFTNVPLSETSMTHSHLRRDKKTVVSQR